MENNTKNKFLIQTNSFIAIGMMVVACLIVPKYNAGYFNGNIRCITLFALALLFGLTQMFRKNKRVHFYTTDLAWLGLIAFTGASVFWSVNEIYAIYGLATTTLLYLCYKTFEAVEWTGKTARYLVAALVFCMLIIFGLEVQILQRKLFPFLFPGNDLERPVLKQLGLNFNFLGSALLILSPFFLFRESKKSTLVDVFLIGFVLTVTHFSGSAQVMLAGIFVSIFYLIHKLKISGKQVFKLLSGLSVVIFGGLLISYFMQGSLRGISFVTDEFLSQNDRIWMWESSLKMLTDAPLTGQGKNSWELAVGGYGFADCWRCLSDPYKVRLFRHAHNSVFQIASELGIPGLLFYAGIAVLPLVQLYRKKISLSPLALSAVVSLLLFFYLSLAYGVSYNFFNSFSGLTVLAVFSLALCGKSIAQESSAKFTLSSKKFYSGYVLFSILGLFFFSQFYQAENSYKKARIFFNQKNYEAATTTFSDAMPYWDKASVYKYIATIAQRTGDPQNAINYMEKAVEKNPFSPHYNLQYGNLLFHAGAYQRAQKVALDNYNIAPRFIPAEVLLIKCYFKNGEKEKGIVMRDALLKRLKQFVPEYRKGKKRKQKKLPPSIIQRNKKMKKHIKILERLS